MKDLKSLLAKSSTLLVAHLRVRQLVAQVILETLGISVSEKEVSIKRKTAYLTCHPALKNEIFLQKEKILLLLHQQGVSHLVDVR